MRHDRRGLLAEHCDPLLESLYVVVSPALVLRCVVHAVGEPVDQHLIIYVLEEQRISLLDVFLEQLGLLHRARESIQQLSVRLSREHRLDKQLHR